MQHRLANESIIFDQHHSCASVIDLISKVGMMCTVTNLAKFYLKLVREFIVNLLANFNDPVTPYIKKVHVRGKCADLSLALLNFYLILSVPAGYAASFSISQ